MLGNEEEAHDTVHEAFAKLWQQYSSVTKNSYRAFLYATVKNLCIDILRKREVTKRYEEWAAQNDTEYDNHINEERLQCLETEITALPSLTQKIIEACFFRQSTYREAACILGISESAVKYHVYKAFNELKTKIKEKGLL